VSEDEGNEHKPTQAQVQQEKQQVESIYTGMMIEALLKSKNRRTTIDDAAYIAQRLKPSPGAKLLDTPCGTGRLCIELAGYGFQLTGVDLSRESIATCKQGAAERGVTVDWQERDMRDLPWTDEFEGTYCWWDSFGYLDDEGNRAHLAALHQALRPGGRLLLEAHIAESIFMRLPVRDWSWAGEMLWMEEVTFDPPSARLHRRWTFIRNGVIERQLVTMRLYTYREVVTLLQQVGFTGIETYAHRSDQPFRYAGSRLNVLAHKAVR
jgi:SAM-dependent methyltransferase